MARKSSRKKKKQQRIRFRVVFSERFVFFFFISRSSFSYIRIIFRYLLFFFVFFYHVNHVFSEHDVNHTTRSTGTRIYPYDACDSRFEVAVFRVFQRLNARVRSSNFRWARYVRRLCHTSHRTAMRNFRVNLRDCLEFRVKRCTRAHAPHFIIINDIIFAGK